MSSKLNKNTRKLKAAMKYYINTSDDTRLNNIKKLINERKQLLNDIASTERKDD